jgi:uncharacterized coiled-coil DUF342 family protein
MELPATKPARWQFTYPSGRNEEEPAMAQKTVKVPEFLREPLEAAQHRLENLEVETQRVVKDLVQKSREGRREIADLVQKLSKQDWTVDELKSRMEKLRHHGVELAAGYADRARHEAVERLLELQHRAIAFLGVASKEQVETLSRELDRLSKRLGKAKARKAGRPGTVV